MGFLSDLISNPLGAVLQQAYDETSPYLTPFTAQVPGLLRQLVGGNLDITQDPSYRFRLNQGLDAVQNRFAASGSPFSGAAARALNDYAQQAASQEYGARYGRLSDLLQLGYGAGSDLLNARLRAAGVQADNLYGAGVQSGRAIQTGFGQAQDLARTFLPFVIGG
jgi:hypothetical protein